MWGAFALILSFILTLDMGQDKQVILTLVLGPERIGCSGPGASTKQPLECGTGVQCKAVRIISRPRLKSEDFSILRDQSRSAGKTPSLSLAWPFPTEVKEIDRSLRGEVD